MSRRESIGSTNIMAMTGAAGTCVDQRKRRLSGKVRVAILKKARAADPYLTTSADIYRAIVAEFGDVVCESTVRRLIKSRGIKLDGMRAMNGIRQRQRVKLMPELRENSRERMRELYASDPSLVERSRKALEVARANPHFKLNQTAALKRRMAGVTESKLPRRSADGRFMPRVANDDTV